MSEAPPDRPFTRKALIDGDTLVGARWWQESLRLSAEPLSRRRALKGLLLLLGGSAAGLGLFAALSQPADELDVTMDALDLQKREGWNAGQAGTALRFPGAIAVDADGGPGWVDGRTTLASDLAPAQASLAPFYVPTLFQALGAGSNASLRSAMTPVAPRAGGEDALRGKSILSLFEAVKMPADTAVILDVDGPTAVAVAAGMTPGFEPVFIFDNWPHPLGVVASHLTLGAVLYHRPVFLRARGARAVPAPPVFVLDRNRLSHYADEDDQFDNRYVARLPTATSLRELGIRHVLYVPPGKSDMRELDDLNDAVFPDGTFDVSNLAGMRKPGEKGIPYGRLRNFLRLAGLVELKENALERPVFTWLDQDNELGALVLTRAGTLAKRHVFNYFDQKSAIFDKPGMMVGGGGYTNDALEGVEKFWVAWGILHNALALAQEHAPHDPAILAPQADITRFRPWDQPETLERLPREGENVETMSDQFLLLLNTLVGTFRGKYDNQVQIYHPWTYGYVAPDSEDLVEEMRPFAGMPGGNTSFTTDVLASPIPFITVAGRGEDIFHLWQLEGCHGPGSIFLTHTPALHTRNVRAGRGDLMSEIINSYNGRIFREPPYLWSALARLSAGDPTPPGPDVEAETSERIEGLRAEAKASMAAVSGFASGMEPYVDEKSEFWWLARAQSDPRCAEVLATLRGVVHEFKDVEKYHRLADEKLLGLDDVKELTAQFVAAYPHWETVVERVGGIRGETGPGAAGALTAGPREDYGSGLREGVASVPSYAGTAVVAEPPSPFEPVEQAPWEDVLASSLLLFRRYERGRADQDEVLGWAERVARLRSIYDHYATPAPDLPAFVWTRLYRDALLIPHSAPYRAVTQLLNDDAPPLGAEERRAAVRRAAETFGVEEELLAEALDLVPLAA